LNDQDKLSKAEKRREAAKKYYNANKDKINDRKIRKYEDDKNKIWEINEK